MKLNFSILSEELFLIGSAYDMAIGPIGENQEKPRPAEDLNSFESLAEDAKSVPHTLPVSRKILVEEFQDSGKPFGTVLEKEAE